MRSATGSLAEGVALNAGVIGHYRQPCGPYVMNVIRVQCSSQIL
jgi:hypothetical protein